MPMLGQKTIPDYTYRRPRRYRSIAMTVAAMCLVCALAAWLWRVHAWEKANRWLALRACCQYSTQPDQAVYAIEARKWQSQPGADVDVQVEMGDPAVIARLRQSRDYCPAKLSLYRGDVGFEVDDVLVHQPDCLVRLMSQMDRRTGWDGVQYLHEVRTPRGDACLLVLAIHSKYDMPAIQELRWMTVMQAWPWQSPLVRSGSQQIRNVDLQRFSQLRPARPDPVDPSSVLVSIPRTDVPFRVYRVQIRNDFSVTVMPVGD
jgi:hypothetical protein